MTTLVGCNDTAASIFNAPNYIVMTKYQAATSGRVTSIQFRAKASTAGKVTIGIYSDNSGNPLSLLGTTASTDISSGVERGISIPVVSSFTVVAGTWYWIAFNSNIEIVGTHSASGTRYYKAYTYAALPESAGSGYSSHYDSPDILAGLGDALQTIIPSGIASALAFGSPGVYPEQTLSPSAIASALAFGTPALKAVQAIIQSAVASALAFGNPAIIRPLNHFIVTASYMEDTPLSNYFFVIGQDSTGNQVSGSAEDSTEPALVGSRLDVVHDGAVSSSADAAAAAAAMVARARLEKRRAGITVPPHCGLELWDVVSVTDTQGNQSARSYRVVSYRLDYDMKKAIYRHTIELSAI